MRNLSSRGRGRSKRGRVDTGKKSQSPTTGVAGCVSCLLVPWWTAGEVVVEREDLRVLAGTLGTTGVGSGAPGVP